MSQGLVCLFVSLRGVEMTWHEPLIRSHEHLVKSYCGDERTERRKKIVKRGEHAAAGVDLLSDVMQPRDETPRAVIMGSCAAGGVLCI